MCSRLHLFLPIEDLRAALGPSSAGAASHRNDVYAVPTAIVSAILACMWTVHGKLDTAGSLYMLLSVLYLRVVLHPAKKEERKKQVPADAFSGDSSRIGLLLTLVMCTVAFAYGFFAPVVGIMSMASSNMYSNSLQYVRGNHYFSPTFLLQEHYASRSPLELRQLPSDAALWDRLEAHAVDAFGGGLVRVDMTTSKTMHEFATAEVSDLLPERAKRFLEAVGHHGHYHEMYARRNYFERPMFQLGASSIHGADDRQDVSEFEAGSATTTTPYVESVYELRRVLALARDREGSFDVVYTPLPAHLRSIEEWRDFVGPQTKYAFRASSPGECRIVDPTATAPDAADEEAPASNLTRADAATAAQCLPGEVALLDPPPVWLTKLLLPYPIPIFASDSINEPYCST